MIKIKSGSLTFEHTIIPIDFGFVDDDNENIITLTLFAAKTVNFSEDFCNEILVVEFKGDFETVVNQKLFAHRLSIQNIITSQREIFLKCYKEIIIESKTKYPEDIADPEDMVYFIELEGLKMQFVDTTTTVKYRNDKEIGLKDFNWDYTETELTLDNIKYKQLFPRKKNNESVLVEFKGLSLSSFNNVILEYQYFLSLLNGANVEIRKIYTGTFYSIVNQTYEINSQKVILRSFEKNKNKRYNEYVPIDDPFARSSRILKNAFEKCFNKYLEQNKILNLNSIIFYLSNSEQAISINEKFFVQIIVLERLANNYLEATKTQARFHIDPNIFAEIQTRFLGLINTDYSTVEGINSIKSKFCESNSIKSKTENKFIHLIEGAGIILTEEISNLINLVRNSAIHEGRIGDDPSKIKHMFRLDQLLRDILLNFINYVDPLPRKKSHHLS